jgi:septal ring factor EnvC (AmiA/AmiB activator)
MSDQDQWANLERQRHSLTREIATMEAKLAKLREKLETVEQAEQHILIDHIETCFSEVDHTFADLKQYAASLIHDIKGSSD